MHFLKKLKKVIREQNSHLCIGLDSDLRQIPKFLLSYEEPVFIFNKLIIDATSSIVCAYKMNTAFYEKAGINGWNTLSKTIKYISKDLITIADAKRGDIENTSERYAQNFLDELDFDSITIQPYMGSDSVRPFIRRKNKFVFLLALTSNYGSKDFQFLKIGKKALFEIIIEKALEWNDHKIGFVVGANHIHELDSITKKYHDVPILVPGIGAQKNSLPRTIKALNHNQFIINQSRSIIYSAPKAIDESEFKNVVYEKALYVKEEINQLRKE